MVLKAEAAHARQFGVQIVGGQHRDDHCRAAGASLFSQTFDLLDSWHLAVAEHQVERPPEALSLPQGCDRLVDRGRLFDLCAEMAERLDEDAPAAGVAVGYQSAETAQVVVWYGFAHRVGYLQRCGELKCAALTGLAVDPHP